MLTIFPIADGVPIQAEPLTDSLPWLTNSILVTAIVMLIILVLARRATARMKLVPAGTQNLFEAIVSGLYDMLEGVVGKRMIARTFPLLATIFIFILTANWFGLLPGVGTVGFGEIDGPLRSLKEVTHPLLRPPNADLNMTLGMSAVFMLVWLWWLLSEAGPVKFIKHTFLPKGDVKGGMWLGMLPLFLFVGVIEIVSIAFRPVSLSFRLFGNIFAGENLMHTMGTLGDAAGPPFSYLFSVLLPLPFYIMELVVGLIQALVFLLLCAVYIQMDISHEEGEH